MGKDVILGIDNIAAQQTLIRGSSRHVRWLKSSIATGGRTTMSQVSASIEASPWYTLRLDEYVKQTPAMSQHGLLVVKMLQDLEVIHTLPNQCELFLDMAQKLSGMVSCESLVNKFNSKIKACWAVMRSKAEEATEANLSVLCVALKEVAIMFPIDPDIQDIADQCSHHLEQHGQRKIIETCNALSDDDLDDIGALDNSAAIVFEKLHCHKLESLTFEDSDINILCGKVERIVKICEMYWDLKKDIPELVRSCGTS